MNEILKELNLNGRANSAQLAAMFDMSEKQIEENIAALESKGIIKGYRAVIDWELAGRDDYVRAIIEVRVSPKKDKGFESTAEEIAKFEEVDTVYLMSGGYDLAALVTAKTFRELATFVSKKLSPLDSVLSTATHFILRTYKEAGINFGEDEVDERGVVSPW